MTEYEFYLTVELFTNLQCSECKLDIKSVAGRLHPYLKMTIKIYSPNAAISS
jgi:hypothetical protein